MAFGFTGDGATGSVPFNGMEIHAEIEAKNVTERDFVYGCVFMAMDLLTHYMTPANAAVILQKHIASAVTVFERQRS